MAVYRLLQNMPLGPDDISRLVVAYGETLKALGLKDRNDPITRLVAKKVIEIAETGVRDPLEVAARAISISEPRSRKRALPRRRIAREPAISMTLA